MAGEAVCSSGVRITPPEPERDKEESANGADQHFSVGAQPAGHAVECRYESLTEGRFFQDAAGQEQGEREPGQLLEIGTKHVLQAPWLPGNVEGTKPLNMRARRPQADKAQDNA